MTEQYLVKPDTDERNLHRVGERGTPPCGARAPEWASVSLAEAREGDFGVCRNRQCFGGDDGEDPIEVDEDGLPGSECVDCEATGDEVMQREVGRRTVRLCAGCAAERRRLTPPRVLSGASDNTGGDAATRG